MRDENSPHGHDGRESCQVQSGCDRVWALPQHWRDVTVTVKVKVKVTVKKKSDSD